jgi:hypothetical protein
VYEIYKNKENEVKNKVVHLILKELKIVFQKIIIMEYYLEFLTCIEHKLTDPKNILVLLHLIIGPLTKN